MIDEDGTKVTNNVDDTKHETIPRKHCQIASLAITGHGSTRHQLLAIRILIVRVCAGTIRGVNIIALILGVRNGLIQELVNLELYGAKGERQSDQMKQRANGKVM